MMQSDEQVLYTIFGVGLCLGGWLLFWLGSRLVGLALGMSFGFVFGNLLALVLKLEENPTLLVLLACSLMGAFGGFLLMRAATTFVFGLAGFLFGALLGRMGAEFYALYHEDDFAFTAPVVLAVVGSGLLMGLLAVYMQKYIMIVVTSYVGATFLVGGVEFLQTHMPWSFLCVIIAAIGWQSILVGRLLSDRRRAQQDLEE